MEADVKRLDATGDRHAWRQIDTREEAEAGTTSEGPTVSTGCDVGVRSASVRSR